MRLSPRLVGSFARAVGVLMGGTALGHAITAAALPVLTRLYTPAEFGMLAAFTAVTSIIVVAACLRYELAITLPDQDDEARSLVVVAGGMAVLTGLVVALPVVLAPQAVSRWLGQPGLLPHLWMIPACTVLAGAFAALQYWHVRRKSFPLLAVTRVAQSAAASGGQLLFGLVGVGAVGLLAGPLLSSLAGAVVLAVWTWREGFGPPGAQTRNVSVWRSIRRHKAFVVYSTPEALANAASIHLPVLMLAALAGATEAGHLVLALAVIQAPMALLGNAVGQVFLSRAADEARAGRLADLTADVVARLSRLAVGPLLFIGVVAPWGFAPLFGAGWERGGVVVAWLTPWFVLNLLTAPISTAMHVLGRQRLALTLQVLGLVLRTGAVALAGYGLGGHHTEAYAISGWVFYALYLATVLRLAGCTVGQLHDAWQAAWPNCARWLGAGIAVSLLLMSMT
jgi:O-antigen/teichoic acid export membrane protein